MKKRLLVIFVIVFWFSFAVLNSRFIIATANYYLKRQEIAGANPSARLLPVTEAAVEKPLPNLAQLVIDGINVSAPIVFGSGDDDEAIYKSLEKGVVHYSYTPKPGSSEGVSVILGHSSAYPWYQGGFGSVFALLGRINAGDKIHIQYEDGRTFTYIVKRSIVFSPFADNSRLQELENKDKSTLVLLSCWPVGTNYKRIAVEAELI